MKKVIFFLAMGVFLNSCSQYSSLIGPTYTITKTGNAFQTALSYHSNILIKKKTGKNTFEHMHVFLEKKDTEVNLDENLIALIQTNIKKTRKKIFSKR